MGQHRLNESGNTMKPYPFILRACLSLLVACLFTSTGWAQPTLVSTSPATGASGVPTTTAVVFQFSERMNQTPPQSGMSWFALSGGTMFQSIDEKMTYEWSGDGRSFTARCTGGFPSGVLIAWDMSAFEFTRFIDDSELDQDYSGGFNTAAGSGGGGGGAGTGEAKLSVSIQSSYEQFSSSAPVLSASNPYIFTANAELAATRVATNATVTPPGKPAITLLGSPFNTPTNFVTATFSNSLPNLQASFPAGTYQFSIQGPGSNQLASAALPAGSPPAAVSVLNYTAAQTVDPAQPFVLQFDAGGVATNFVFVQIKESLSGQTIYESPDLGFTGALTGVSNHVRFAAGTFQPGRTYDVYVQRFIAYSNSVAGTLSLTGYGASTQTKLRTTGGAMSHIVRITDPTKLGNTFGVVVSLGTNATYHFERTVDFTNWVSLQTLVPTSTNIQAVVDLSPPSGSAFYRFRRE